MTLLFHVDESIQNGSFQVHLGLLADGDQIAEFQKRLADLWWDATEAGARGDVEFHAYDMLQARGDWRRVDIADAVDLVRSALRSIDELDIEVIVRAANLATVRKRRGADFDLYPMMFSNLLERLNERLGGRGEYGLVIADEQHEYVDRLKVLVHRWQRQGTWGYRGQVLSRVLDAVHFVDSSLSPMTQLADMAAYVHGRRLANPTESNPKVEAAMKELHGLVMAGVPAPTGAYCTTWIG